MSLYLITGIGGFIGSSIARELVKRGEGVRGFDDFSTGRRENLAAIGGKIDLREASILDPAALADAMRGVDYVLHQAAIPSVPRSVADPAGTCTVNMNGTLNVLIAGKDAKVKRVVYAASSSAYGDTPTMPKHEAMPTDPISPYAVAKLTGEYFLKSFYRCYGFETVSLRYFNIFGPWQDPGSPYSAVFAKFITAMLAGQRPTIYGDGEQSRDFTYIDNAVSANLLACTAPAEKVAGRMVNIATGRRISLNEAYAALQQIIGFHEPVIYAPERAGDVKHSLADITEARTRLGYEVLVPFEEGLRRTVAWYREQAAAKPAAAKA